MVFFRRRRLIVWLAKAYLKRWGKSILIFFSIGIALFILLFANINFLFSVLPISQNRTVGLTGSYTVNNLPPFILDQISKGLTFIDENGNIKPSAAKKWEIRDSGKTYIFYLDENAKYSDGKKLTSESVNYGFSDVEVLKPNPSTVIFKLKDSYSPFLLTASRKLFKDGFVGLGEYRVKDVKLNGDFVQTIEVSKISEPRKSITYQFYPTQEALKTSFLLGETDEVDDVTDLTYKDMKLDSFKNVTAVKNTNYQKLVTVFYDNQDKVLSDKRVRKALSYAIPDEFTQGQRNFSPFSPRLWATETLVNPYKQDLEHSMILLESASSSAELILTIKVLPQYTDVAKQISKSWNKIGISTIIEPVDYVPTTFQVFLGEFNLSRDPDQYALWHTGQPSNITNYKNLRIDKLLEDGRKTVSKKERESIYADFEKYLLDDSPATFLYLPYTYDIIRK